MVGEMRKDIHEGIPSPFGRGLGEGLKRSQNTLFPFLFCFLLLQRLENQKLSFCLSSLLRLTPALSQRDREIKPNKDLARHAQPLRYPDHFRNPRAETVDNP